VNTVKTHNKKRRQYDVIAGKGDQVFLVEGKKWAGSRYRLSALKKAVEQHKERTTFYNNITSENAIPLLVTLIERRYGCMKEFRWCQSRSSTPLYAIWTGTRGEPFFAILNDEIISPGEISG
jgi:hypothetical protein